MTQTATEPASESEADFELTPEILSYENRRTDLILALGLVAFAFFLGFFKESSADLFLWLRSGQLTAENFPNIPKTDSFTYTAFGKPWIQPAWLFDYMTYLAYSRLGEQSLTILKSLLIVASLALLVQIRHRGSTLWGTVIVLALALVATSRWLALSPDIPALLLFSLFLWVWHRALYEGRFGWIYWSVPIALVWANMDLSFYFPAAIVLLSFVGEAIQEVLPAGWSFRPRTLKADQLVQLLVVGCLCLLAGLVTPFGWQGLALRYEWFAEVLPHVSIYDRELAGWAVLSPERLMSVLVEGQASWDRLAWVLLAVAAVVAQGVNYRYVNVTRLLLTIFAILAGVLVERYIGYSAVLLALVTGLAGQELFLATYGTETRISRGWLAWSQGGRGLTILALFVFILAAFTGRIQQIPGRFGAGIVHERYMENAVPWFKEMNPKGHGFAFVNRIAAYRDWALPELKNFADSRWQVMTDVLGEFSQARQALADRRPEEWKPIFAKYGITHVLIDPSDRRLRLPLIVMLDSPDLVPLYVSDQVVILGLAGDNVDKDLFARIRIRPNAMVFHQNRPLPKPTDRFVEPPGLIDWVWQSRRRNPRGLVTGTIFTTGASGLEYPGGFYLGLSNIRDAVSASPDNSESYYQLGFAYQQIYRLESLEYGLARKAALSAAEQKKKPAKDKAEASSKKPADKGPENKSAATKNSPPAAPPTAKVQSAPSIGPADTAKAAGKDSAPGTGVPTPSPSPTAGNATAPGGAPNPPIDTETAQRIELTPSRYLLATRHYQIVAALRSSVIAGPTDNRPYFAMFEFCRFNELYDTALANLELGLSHTYNPQAEQRLRTEILPALRAEVDKRRQQFDEVVAKMEEQGAGDRTLEKMQVALQLNLPDLAIAQVEASSFGQEMFRTAPLAIATYLMVGETEKADNQLRAIRDQRVLPPGEWDWWSAQVRMLLGQYEEARNLLEHAIAELRASRVTRGLQTLENRLRGGIATEAGDLLSVPFEANALLADIEREAYYQFVLGLLRIEMGEPKLATPLFEKTLAMVPRNPMRPIIGWYWRLMTGKALPPEPPPSRVEEDIVIRFAPPAAAPAATTVPARPGTAPSPATKSSVSAPITRPIRPDKSAPPAAKPSEEKAKKG